MSVSRCPNNTRGGVFRQKDASQRSLPRCSPHIGSESDTTRIRRTAYRMTHMIPFSQSCPSRLTNISRPPQSLSHLLSFRRCPSKYHNRRNQDYTCHRNDNSVVIGQFLDYAQSQRHSVRSTRRQANNCPFLVFLVDYFFTFSTLATASGVQDASCRLSPRPRRSLRGNATPTPPQALPYSPRLNRPRPSPRLHHCRSAGSLSAMP